MLSSAFYGKLVPCQSQQRGRPPRARARARLSKVTRAQANDDFSIVMYSRVKSPNVAVFPGNTCDSCKNSVDVIVDGSAFKISGKNAPSEYFNVMVHSQLECGFSRALEKKISWALRDVNPSEPIYYVAVLQLNYLHVDVLEYYLVCYLGGSLTFKRAVFGPRLLEELKAVL